jgi:serine protease inhibitor
MIVSPLFHCLCVTIALAGQAPVPDSGASIYGQIRTSAGLPVAGAEVEAWGTRLSTRADAQGRFDLRGLPSGTVYLSVSGIGFDAIDRRFRLRRGQRLRWNAVIPISKWEARRAQQEVTLAAAGGLDSIARGLAFTDTATGFTYERFGIGVLRAVLAHASTDSSRVISPLSAGQALAVALGAAKDSTAFAIARGLDLGALGSEGLATRSRRFNSAVRTRRDITLRIANALWIDTSATLQVPFAHWASEYYSALVRSLPLRSPQVLSILNRWADTTTKGAIPKIRDRPFRDSVKVVLTNAVYFKGQWLEPFDSSLTQDRPFTTAAGGHITTPTMDRTADLGYRRGSGYRALRIPYTAGLTAMYVVLPDSGVDATSLVGNLERTGWPVPDPRTESKEVHVRLPRLHIAQATDLRPPFTDLDMGILFDSARADFGGLVVPRPNQPPPCPPLSSGVHLDACTRYRISDASQHVYLDVNERGTVAAAVTTIAFEVVPTAVAPPPIQFIVDHPFLFALRDERTGTLLFVGFIASPRQ